MYHYKNLQKAYEGEKLRSIKAFYVSSALLLSVVSPHVRYILFIQPFHISDENKRSISIKEFTLQLILYRKFGAIPMDSLWFSEVAASMAGPEILFCIRLSKSENDSVSIQSIYQSHDLLLLTWHKYCCDDRTIHWLMFVYFKTTNPQGYPFLEKDHFPTNLTTFSSPLIIKRQPMLFVLLTKWRV